MARTLSSLFLRNIRSFPAARSNCQLKTFIYGSLYANGMRYSTTGSNDLVTHEDFRPTSKLEGSALSAKETVEQDVKENPVMIYMKGIPEMPRCGFSSLAVRVLNEYVTGPLFPKSLSRESSLEGQILFSTCTRMVSWGRSSKISYLLRRRHQIK